MNPLISNSNFRPTPRPFAISHQTSANCGLLISTTLALMVVADVIRKVTPSQPIWISVLPYILTIWGAVYSIFFRHQWSFLSISARRGMIGIVITCTFGTFVAVFKGVPVIQIAAGWISHLGLIFGLLLGHCVGCSLKSWNKLYSTIVILVILNLFAAVGQQFGILQSELLDPIENLSSIRVVRGEGVFRYSTGLFRSPDVFSLFLAFAALTVCNSTKDTAGNKTSSLSIYHLFLIALTLGGALLAARRSAFVIQLSLLIPFFILSSNKLRTVGIVLVVIVSISFIVIANDVDIHNEGSQYVNLKVKHIQVPEGIFNRFLAAFDVQERDFLLITLSGDGLGSHSHPVRAGSDAAIAREITFLDHYAITHYGWFQDLLIFGPFGAFLHLMSFAALAYSLFNAGRKAKMNKAPWCWSGTAFFLTAIFIYYVLAPVHLLTLSSGIISGCAIGTSLARGNYSILVQRKRDSMIAQLSRSRLI